jgi:hypothetical protein
MLGFDSKDVFFVFPSFFWGVSKAKKTVSLFFAFCIHAINQYLRKTKNSFLLLLKPFQKHLMFTEVNVCK